MMLVLEYTGQTLCIAFRRRAHPMCTDTCTDMCTDTCTDMCTDTCTDMCVDMCQIEMRNDGRVKGVHGQVDTDAITNMP